MKGSFLSRMRGWAGQASDFGKARATGLSRRIGEAVQETGSSDPNPMVDTSIHVHVAKSYLKKVRDMMKGTNKQAADDSAQEKKDKTRAQGQAIGSATTHFITGYAAAPLLYAHKDKPTLTHGVPSAAFAKKTKSIGESLAQRFRSPKRIMSGIRKNYGTSALKPALALTGVALAGGYMKERIQAGYERAHAKKEASGDGCEEIAAVNGEGGGETMRVSGNVTAPDWVKEERRRSKEHEKKAAGIFVYQRDPSEVKETKHPGKPKGATASFGTRMSPRHAIHKRDQEQAEGWMKGNAEFVELGDRPGLAQSFQTIVGTEKEQVLNRRDAQKLLGERDRIKLLCKEHRHGAKKGEVEYNPNTERDLLEVLDSVETILQNPKVQAIQVVER